MIRSQLFSICVGLAAFTSSSVQNAFAQELSQATPATESKIIDEVISRGQITSSDHDGMKAFFDGDFATAEIEFEREFLSLKRGISSREFAIFQAVNGQRNSQSLESALSSGANAANGAGTVGVGTSTQNSGGSQSFTPSATGGLKNKDETGRGILTDGKVTDNDFSFSKYMAGLSELQLGKFDQAEKSFKTAIFYNSKNYDARLRLGLLHLKNSKYEDAAKQLEKLDKLRRKCIKAACKDKTYITEATIELANVITATANHQR